MKPTQEQRKRLRMVGHYVRFMRALDKLRGQASSLALAANVVLEHHDPATGVSARQVSLEQALKNRIAWRRLKRATIEGMIDTARGRIFETEAERAAHLAALHDDLDREELLIDELEALLVDPGLDKLPGDAYNGDEEGKNY